MITQQLMRQLVDILGDPNDIKNKGTKKTFNSVETDKGNQFKYINPKIEVECVLLGNKWHWVFTGSVIVYNDAKV